MWKQSNFFLFLYILSCPSIICKIDYSGYSFPLNCLGTLAKNQVIINVRVYFWNSADSIPFMYKSIFIPRSHRLNYYYFVEGFKLGSVNSLTLFIYLFARIVLTILCPMNFHMNFRTNLLLSGGGKKSTQNLIEIVLNLTIKLGKIVIRTIFSYP